MFKIIVCRVAGVTFDGRQELIARIQPGDPCRLEPEPENPYDANAIAVKVANIAGIFHIGYLPREVAAMVAPALDDEDLMVDILEIVGGFEFDNGQQAPLGVRISIEVPDPDGQL